MFLVMGAPKASHGLAGQIQVTEAVRVALADDFDFLGPKLSMLGARARRRAVWFLRLREQASNGVAS
jgi:hypothetical protein